MNAKDSIMRGLEEALAFAEGQQGRVRVHQVSVPEVDVVKIREETKFSQAEFALSISMAKGTLLNWEYGRRQPTGPARVLLALITKDPGVVQTLLR